jgi:hypothetical protein
VFLTFDESKRFLSGAVYRQLDDDVRELDDRESLCPESALSGRTINASLYLREFVVVDYLVSVLVDLLRRDKCQCVSYK